MDENDTTPFRVWAIALPDMPPYELRDLPVDVLDQLGAPYGLSWADVINDPAARAGLLARTLAAVAALTNTDLPIAATGRDVMAALRHLVVLVSAEDSDDPEE